MSQLNVLSLDIPQPTDFKADKSISGGAFFGSATDNGCCDKKPESSFAHVIDRHLEEKNSRSGDVDKNTEQKQIDAHAGSESKPLKSNVNAKSSSAESSHSAENVEQLPQGTLAAEVHDNNSQDALADEQENSIDFVNTHDCEKANSVDEKSNAFINMLFAAGEMLLGKKAETSGMENDVNTVFSKKVDSESSEKSNGLGVDTKLHNNQKSTQFEISAEIAAQLKTKLILDDQSTQPVQPVMPIVSEVDGVDGEQLSALLAQTKQATKVAELSVNALSNTNKLGKTAEVLQQELINIQQSLQGVSSQVEQGDVELLKALTNDAELLTNKVGNLLTKEQANKLFTDLASLKPSDYISLNKDAKAVSNLGHEIDAKNEKTTEINFAQAALNAINATNKDVIKNNGGFTVSNSTTPMVKAFAQSFGQSVSQQDSENELVESGIESFSEINDSVEEYVSSKVFSDNIKHDSNVQIANTASGIQVISGNIQANVESQFLSSQARADANAADLAIDNMVMKQSPEFSQLQKSQQLQLNEVVNVFRKDFADSLKDKVMIMMSNRLQQIDIQLDPPEFGNMHVRVNLQNEQAAVSFVVQNQQAKEAVEQQLTRLREMLAERGIDVGDANVRQENPNKNQQMANDQGKENRSQFSSAEDGEFVQHEMSLQQLVNASSNGVDFYA